MAGFDVQRVIAAYQAGQQVKRQQEQKEMEAEDRKFEMEKRGLELKALKLAEKMRAREEAIQTAGLQQGQPAEEFGGFSLSATPGGVREDTEAPVGPDMFTALTGRQRPQAPTFTAPIAGASQPPTELPLAPVTIPGVQGPDTTVQPQSMQDLRRMQRRQKVFESQLKQDENRITIPPIPSLGINAPVEVDKTLADNLLNQAGSNVRQGQQQEFTAEQNEAKAKADAEQSRLDRESRERIALANRVAAAERALASGKQSRTVQQAITMANQFDGNAITKNYAVVREGADFARSLKGGTSADDIGLLYAFAKAMDPGSVVREGEYATVQKYAQSWAEQFGFKVARIFSNTPFLSDQAKTNMIATITSKEQAAKRSYENLRKEASKKFENLKENPEDWLANYNVGAGNAVPPPKDPKSMSTDELLRELTK